MSAKILRRGSFLFSCHVLGILAGVGCSLVGVLPLPRVLAEEQGIAREIEQAFRDPPNAVKPWAYWWWIKGNVTESSITRDLEQMKQKGYAGLLLFDARGYHEDHLPPPESRCEFMDGEWRRMVRFALAEADRLGLRVSINLSSCAGALRGPWAVGEDLPKKLAWLSREVVGPQQVRCQLHDASWGRCWDVATVAARHGDSGASPSAAGPVAVEVVDLSDRVVARGASRLGRAPPGRWTLLPFCVPGDGRA